MKHLALLSALYFTGAQTAATHPVSCPWQTLSRHEAKLLRRF